MLLMRTFKGMKKGWQLYVIIFLPLLYILIFKYVPMFGVLIAFKDYNVVKGILGSPWAGLHHFEQFFTSPNFIRIVKNTFVLSLISTLFGFPLPIILALMMNEISNGYFKKSVQMVTYAPYFISMVVMVSLIMLFLSPETGMVNKALQAVGFSAKDYMADGPLFKYIYSLSGVWQNTGYAAIIYLAALAGVNPDLYEASKVDGASRLQKIRHVDIPGILPAIIILLILEIGQFMKIGFEKVYLMQNPLNSEYSEIIATYVYKVGLLGANFSFSAAVGLFNSVINLVLIITVNYIAGKVSENSLW